MYIKINCKHNDGAWCKCTKIKRSLLGFGARMCIEFKDEDCPYYEQRPSPFGKPTTKNPTHAKHQCLDKPKGRRLNHINEKDE